MHNPARLTALGLTTALALQGVAVTQPSVLALSVVAAQAAEIASLPSDQLLNPPADAARYEGAFTSFDTIYRARQYYADSATEWNEDFYAFDSPRASWKGLGWAKQHARIALAARTFVLLQAEDFPEARALDLTTLGYKEATDLKAKEILSEAKKKFAELKDQPNAEAWYQTRYTDIVRSLAILETYTNGIVEVKRIPIAAVIDWGVPDKYPTDSAQRAKKEDFADLEIYKVEYNESKADQNFVTETAEANAQTNTGVLEAAHGPLQPADSGEVDFDRQKSDLKEKIADTLERAQALADSQEFVSKAEELTATVEAIDSEMKLQQATEEVNAFARSVEKAASDELAAQKQVYTTKLQEARAQITALVAAEIAENTRTRILNELDELERGVADATDRAALESLSSAIETALLNVSVHTHRAEALRELATTDAAVQAIGDDAISNKAEDIRSRLLDAVSLDGVTRIAEEIEPFKAEAQSSLNQKVGEILRETVKVANATQVYAQGADSSLLQAKALQATQMLGALSQADLPELVTKKVAASELKESVLAIKVRVEENYLATAQTSLTERLEAILDKATQLDNQTLKGQAADLLNQVGSSTVHTIKDLKSKVTALEAQLIEAQLDAARQPLIVRLESAKAQAIKLNATEILAQIDTLTDDLSAAQNSEDLAPIEAKIMQVEQDVQDFSANLRAEKSAALMKRLEAAKSGAVAVGADAVVEQAEAVMAEVNAAASVEALEQLVAQVVEVERAVADAVAEKVDAARAPLVKRLEAAKSGAVAVGADAVVEQAEAVMAEVNAAASVSAVRALESQVNAVERALDSFKKEQEKEKEKDTLSTGAIVGIVTAVVAILGVLLAVLAQGIPGINAFLDSLPLPRF
ncbi:hypothetical protein N7326_05075 [Corynebacterium sp. ES2794-CONJ1]|uniref:hypothetical protein n=1 Tax=unclassified Corynebacterium TaxID=2624378 RepID=UPI002167F73A|nr:MULTISPECIES: hypothetical protein [unclassified Corynebacterium]MCS4491744.1 hypothetical protein [Corynebacterium sp. ES2715-CONJ3]MCU9519246.1 hypothetical protein [Corynebacterium sp. ES2794-CONJ1]